MELWTTQPHQQWIWYISLSNTNLYEIRGPTTLVHQIIGRQLHITSCHKIRPTKGTTLLDAQRTTIETTNTNIVFTQGSAPNNCDEIRNQMTLNIIWDEAVAWIKDLLMKDCFKPEDWHNITTSIQNNAYIAITNGSFNLFQMITTACWIIEGNRETHQCKGVAHTLGTRKELDAYRTEIFGI